MSLFDLIFYFFGDYVDNTKQFQSDFSRPAGFDIIQTQQTIHARVHQVEQAIANGLDTDITTSCNELLNEFHQDEFLGGSWTWSAGSISEGINKQALFCFSEMKHKSNFVVFLLIFKSVMPVVQRSI